MMRRTLRITAMFLVAGMIVTAIAAAISLLFPPGLPRLWAWGVDTAVLGILSGTIIDYLYSPWGEK